MYKSILHATDLSENHFEICKKAVKIAEYFKAKLHLLHVIEQPTSFQIAQGLGFAELINPIKDDALTVMKVLGDAVGVLPEQQHVETGSIRHWILEKAKTLHCGLIILGGHTPNGLPTLGSTSYAMHQSKLDVLILH